MGWAIGYDTNYQRDVGYGVPAVCDYPRCNTQIDRGLSYVCGSQPYGGEHGCGLYFCGAHLYGVGVPDDDRNFVQLCDVCAHNIAMGDHWRHFLPGYQPKRDVRTWVKWKLTHDSWQVWRQEHPEEVKLMQIRVGGLR